MMADRQINDLILHTAPEKAFRLLDMPPENFHFLDTLFENLIFSNEDKRKLIQMLMYCIGFSSENYAVGSNECACICVELGKKFMLTEEEQEILYYAALLF